LFLQAPERRDRLQQLMAQLVVAGSVNDAASVLTHRDQKSHAALVAEEREKLKAMSDQTGESELPTVVYSSGSEELKNARVAIAQFSLPRYYTFFPDCVLEFLNFICSLLRAQARLEAEREPANAMKIQSKLSTLQSVQVHSHSSIQHFCPQDNHLQYSVCPLTANVGAIDGSRLRSPVVGLRVQRQRNSTGDCLVGGHAQSLGHSFWTTDHDDQRYIALNI
jgi:hypothetical protein